MGKTFGRTDNTKWVWTAEMYILAQRMTGH